MNGHLGASPRDGQTTLRHRPLVLFARRGWCVRSGEISGSTLRAFQVQGFGESGLSTDLNLESLPIDLGISQASDS